MKGTYNKEPRAENKLQDRELTAGLSVTTRCRRLAPPAARPVTCATVSRPRVVMVSSPACRTRGATMAEGNQWRMPVDTRWR